MGKILLLGGTGALGVYLVEELIKTDNNIYITSRNRHIDYKNVNFIHGNAKDDIFLDEVLKETYDCIVDFMVWPTNIFKEKINKIITKTGHYIFLSSYRVYANADMNLLTENSPLLIDICKDKEYLKTDEYALAKGREERILKNSSYVNYTIVRPSITFSRSRFQIGTLEASSIIPRTIKKQPLMLPKDMMMKRAAVSWSGDVGRMLAFLLGKDKAKQEIFNVATAESHTWREIATYYHNLIGTNIILCDLDSYIKVVCRQYQVSYDRMLNRLVDNSKILNFMKISKNSLTPIKDALEKELADLLAISKRIKENTALCKRMDEQIALLPKPLEYLFPLKKNNNTKTESNKYLSYLSNSLKIDVENFQKSNNNELRNLNKNLLPTDVDKLYKNKDFIKIRYLVTLLKDYGVKHIVLSPGGRDVPIVRMFEYNEKYFTLHMVTDERSAAYYGLGIASQLRKPVVCVCTSGTAASNFLPAVTEAYYTQIPLILITADRYEVYHEQGEDQTIPQKDIYKGVVKKSITLPEGSGWMVERQIKRDIQDCILETIHNNFGPVHINIGIDNVNIGAKIDKKYWTLLPKITPHLLRVSLFDGKEKIQRWINALKKSNKILLVYGQNYLPTPQQKYYIESFASKYNCVIVTDLISNLSCSYSVDPYNMLKNISNQEFNDKLSPDIVITIGGKRLMNDPLTSKIRNGLSNIRHWSVTPNGKVKDFYFHLSSIIEMSQDCFFEYFSNNSGNILNNGIYYEQWRKLIDTISVKEINEFDTNYIQNKFLPNIPKNSILHLGVGLNFYTSRKYKVDKSIYVYCNMGTNGIDGCTSTFMGQCSVIDDKLCFLLVGDLSFFYDMNSIWNKTLKSNMRILMINNNGSGLLRGNQLKFITSQHGTKAEGWVKSTGFTYLSANSKEEFDEKLPIFLDINIKRPLFFEVFCK